MNKELAVLDAANLRWKKRQYSRLLAVGVGLLSLGFFVLDRC